MNFLGHENTQQLQCAAAWAMANIASGNPEQTAVVVKYGAVPKLVKLIGSSNVELKETVIWALGNIAVDSLEFRDLVLSHGAMHKLLEVCNISNMETKNEKSLQRCAAWTLQNLCRYKPFAESQYVTKVIQALTIMIRTRDEKILKYVCRGFSHLSAGDDDDLIMNAIYTSGALNRLIELLEHKRHDIVYPAVKVISNISSGDQEPTQWVIDLGVLRRLKTLLIHKDTPMRKEACFAISNIAAGTQGQVEAVISANLIPSLVNILKNDEYGVAKEASWALSNAARGGT